MKIGILGSGDVGQRLADGFIATGHAVKIGTRSPEKVASWAAKQGNKTTAGGFADAAAFGEIVVIATLWEETPSAIRMAGEKNFAGKVVIDVTNSLDFSKGVPPVLAIANTDSGGETVQCICCQVAE
jgi:8-hydroxy-5-deazaflavin:NADPH oxidoreductase